MPAQAPRFRLRLKFVVADACTEKFAIASNLQKTYPIAHQPQTFPERLLPGARSHFPFRVFAF